MLIDLKPDQQQFGSVPVQAPILTHIGERLRTAHRNHLGYPYNLIGRSPVPPELSGYLVNNLGDPYHGSHYGADVCDLEREVVDWLMDLWEVDEPGAHWGAVGASGTEGNFWALYLAREALPDAIVVYSREAHYSIPKAARILRMPIQVVDCDPSGGMSVASLRSTLSRLRSSEVIVATTCGTTVKGAHDDIGAIISVLDQSGFPDYRRFVHVDGALNAMVLPFLDGVPRGLSPSFRHGVDTISTSGHKMIGTPMPCGVLVSRRRHVERIASSVAYIRSHDTTLMGSRNGHAVLALWARLMSHGVEGFRRDCRGGVERAKKLAETLRREGVPVLLNPFSLTLVFPEPDEVTARRYQLACSGGNAHAIVMPSVSDDLLERFTASYLSWWASSPERASLQVCPSIQGGTT